MKYIYVFKLLQTPEKKRSSYLHLHYFMHNSTLSTHTVPNEGYETKLWNIVQSDSIQVIVLSNRSIPNYLIKTVWSRQ